MKLSAMQIQRVDIAIRLVDTERHEARQNLHDGGYIKDTKPKTYSKSADTQDTKRLVFNLKDWTLLENLTSLIRILEGDNTAVLIAAYFCA